MKKHDEVPQRNAEVKSDFLNPFYHRLQLSTIDVLKIAVMSVTVAPIRLLLVGLLLLMVWPLAAIGIAFRSPEDRNKPFTGWRCILQPLIVLLCRGVFFVGGFKWITVRGVRASSKEAPILTVAPHSSFFDSLALVYLGLTSVVAKEDSQHIPCFGKIIQYTQPVLVSRDDPNSRLNTIREIQRRSQASGQWPQIFIFPEGTCSNRSCLIRFKGGAFFPGVPVQPVCLRYHNKLDTMTWTWDGPGAFQCLWFTLCQFQNHLEIEFLPVYHPSKEEQADAKLFGDNVRYYMAQHLGVPVSDHTYQYRRSLHTPAADKLRLPLEIGIAEFQKLHKKLGLSPEQMQETLSRLEKMDHDSSGRISMSQFAACLQLPESPALQDIFSLYDREQCGSIDCREYVIGLSVVANPDDSEPTLQCAFKLFDKGHKGFITEEELQTILRNAFAMEEASVAQLFHDIDADHDGRITFENFKTYSEKNPDYVKLFVTPQLPAPVSNGHAVANNDSTERMQGYHCQEGNGNLHKRLVAS